MIQTSQEHKEKLYVEKKFPDYTRSHGGSV